jgi:hypothetical protein
MWTEIEIAEFKSRHASGRAAITPAPGEKVPAEELLKLLDAVEFACCHVDMKGIVFRTLEDAAARAVHVLEGL